MSLNCFDGGLEISVYTPPLNQQQRVLEEIRNRPVRRPSTDYWDYVMLNRMLDRQNLNHHEVQTNINDGTCCFPMICKLISLFLRRPQGLHNRSPP